MSGRRVTTWRVSFDVEIVTERPMDAAREAGSYFYELFDEGKIVYATVRDASLVTKREKESPIGEHVCAIRKGSGPKIEVVN